MILFQAFSQRKKKRNEALNQNEIFFSQLLGHYCNHRKMRIIEFNVF